jgi:hypothetical protein
LVQVAVWAFECMETNKSSDREKGSNPERIGTSVPIRDAVPSSAVAPRQAVILS